MIGILIGLAVILFILGVVFLLRDASHDGTIMRRDSEEVTYLQESTVMPEDSSEEQEKTSSTAEEQEVSESVEQESSEEPAAPKLVTLAADPIENPYLEYFEENEDLVGWLLVPDTKIDAAVMWTPEDENYYLNRNFQKKSDKNGCLILDTDSCLDPITTNQIIHGHNMKSGKMFGTLMKYEEQSYAEEHPYIYLYEKDICRKYEVMAVFRSQVYKKTDQVFKFYKFFQADTEEELEEFTSNVLEMSLYDTGVVPQFGDRFITLSTCAYHVNNGRFVVVARECENYLYLEP